MIVPRSTRSSSLAGDDGSAGSAAKKLDVHEREREGDVGDEVARALDDLGSLVAQACTPAVASIARRANQSAKELLEQRKTIHEHERLVASLRSDLAGRAQALVRSEDKQRGLEGELADLRMKQRELESKAARADARAARARDVALGAVADKELAVRRGDDALRRAEQRHVRDLAAAKARSALETAEHVEQALSAQQIELDERVAQVRHLREALALERAARAAEREKHAADIANRDHALAGLLEHQAKVLAEQEMAHRADVAAADRSVALVKSHVADLEALLVVEREAVAASVAAHARALRDGDEKLVRALAERDRAHLVESRARAQAQRAETAERCAKAEEAGKTRAAAAHARIAATLTARLRDAEQSLAESRAKHAREMNDLKLQVAALRESTAAERRLAQHVTELHGRARAELAAVCHELEVAKREAEKREMARDDAQAQLDRFLQSSRDTLDESGVRLACGQGAVDEDGEDDEHHTETDRVAIR